jgi:hypothetical protein
MTPALLPRVAGALPLERPAGAYWLVTTGCGNVNICEDSVVARYVMCRRCQRPCRVELAVAAGEEAHP